MCNSTTLNLNNILKETDILIVAIGKPNFIKGNNLKHGVFIIDVGTNVDLNSKKLIGDVDLNSVN